MGCQNQIKTQNDSIGTQSYSANSTPGCFNKINKLIKRCYKTLMSKSSQNYINIIEDSN